MNDKYQTMCTDAIKGAGKKIKESVQQHGIQGDKGYESYFSWQQAIV